MQKKQYMRGILTLKREDWHLLRAHRGLPKSKALIKFLSEGSNRQVLTKAENFYMAEQNKNMPKVDAELYFVIDEKNNQVELSEKGLN